MNTLPVPARQDKDFNPFEANSFHATSETKNPFADNPFTGGSNQSHEQPNTQSLHGFPELLSKKGMGERIGDKLRVTRELGAKAVSRLVQLAPRLTDKLKRAYASEYGQKVAGVAQGAVSETALVALMGGSHSLGERFGISYENGTFNVQKAKLARGAIRIALNPYGESVKAVKAAGRDAYRLGKAEALRQTRTAGMVFANDAVGYMRGRTY